jgi:succinyl-CoA synthetase alpha subunit
MSILIDDKTNVLVQGITGRDGSFHTRTMVKDGTNIVAGVTPGKGGQEMDGIPVYNSVVDAVKEHEIHATVIFVPAKFAKAAMKDAADAGVPLIITITEGVPVLDMVEMYDYIKEKGLRLIGPNCPGLISPGLCKIGIMPARIHLPAKGEQGIGVISRSGTLTYEVVNNLTNAGMPQSTCIGIGGDPIIGSSFIDLLELFENDPGTKAVVMIGEIGGDAEEASAEYIAKHMKKPVVSFISGRTAPEGKRMGHAGAIISGGKGTPQSKVDALNKAGVPVADKPDEIPGLLAEKLK